MSSAICFSLDLSKILSYGNGLKEKCSTTQRLSEQLAGFSLFFVMLTPPKTNLPLTTGKTSL